MKHHSYVFSSAILAVVTLLAPTATAQDPEVEALKERVEKLEKESREKIETLEKENETLKQRQSVLEGEVERFELRDIIPPVGKDSSFTLGLGPAGSKVYSKEQGLSIGGYGEFLFSKEGGETGVADALRVVNYFGYKFNERFVLNTEIEYEHGTTSASSGTTDSDGSVSAEFAYLDYLHSDELNARGGLVLVPMGLINEFHEPTTFLSARRPQTELRIIPTTWRELGVGLHGVVEGFAYRAYLINGLNGEEFNASGVRDSRQKGNRAAADDWAGVVRVDWVDTPGLLIGASIYFGDAGQDADVAGIGLPDMFTVIAEAHAEYRTGPWRFRGLYASSWIDDAGEFNTITGRNVGDWMQGWYVEAGYDVLAALAPESGQNLTPFVRFEDIDTQASMPAGFTADPAEDNQIVTIGADYFPIDQIVIKSDYEIRNDEADVFNILLGYVF